MKRLIKRSEDDRTLKLIQGIEQKLSNKGLSLPNGLKVKIYDDNSTIMGMCPDGTLDINASSLDDWPNIMHEVGHFFDLENGQFGKYSHSQDWAKIMLAQQYDYNNFKNLYNDLVYENQIDQKVLDTIVTEGWAEAFEGYTNGTRMITPEQTDYISKVLS